MKTTLMLFGFSTQLKDMRLLVVITLLPKSPSNITPLPLSLNLQTHSPVWFLILLNPPVNLLQSSLLLPILNILYLSLLHHLLYLITCLSQPLISRSQIKLLLGYSWSLHLALFFLQPQKIVGIIMYQQINLNLNNLKAALMNRISWQLLGNLTWNKKSSSPL